VGQWWGKLDESNISHKNSSKDVIMNTSVVAYHTQHFVFSYNNRAN